VIFVSFSILFSRLVSGVFSLFSFSVSFILLRNATAKERTHAMPRPDEARNLFGLVVWMSGHVKF